MLNAFQTQEMNGRGILNNTADRACPQDKPQAFFNWGLVPGDQRALQVDFDAKCKDSTTAVYTAVQYTMPKIERMKGRGAQLLKREGAPRTGNPTIS